MYLVGFLVFGLAIFACRVEVSILLAKIISALKIHGG